MPVVSFRDLDVWNDAMALAEECYALTARFPREEMYGLASQVRRAATSIPANIAEGHARPTPAYRNHVNIALASQAELETLLDLAARLNFVSPTELMPVTSRLARIGRRLHRLQAALEQTLQRRHNP